MPVTMKDIATAAGVSVGTVDRALHNRGRIAPEVKQRILFIAEQLNYQKNMAASSLATREKKYKIAVVLHVQQNDFYTDIISGITRAEREINDFGITVEIYRGNDFDVKEQIQLIDTAISNGASAMAIVPIDHPSVVERLTELYNEKFPVIFLSSVLEKAPCISAVRCNYAKSGFIAAGLVRLISKSPESVLVFTPSLSMMGHRYRIDGFKKALAQKAPEITLKAIIELPNDSFDSYKIASEKLMLNSEVNVVVYCGSARAGLKAIQDCGRTIHSVFYDYAPHTKAALLENKVDAVILQNPQEQGYLAIMTLFDYLISQKPPKAVIEVENYILIPECLAELDDFTELPN